MEIPKQLVLCVDWSNIMYRSLFMTQIYGTNSNYNTQDELDSFIWKLATDISYILRTFKPDKVIFCSDSHKPWRKQILAGENGYKSNRKKTDGRNWENIFDTSDDLKELMRSKGFKFAECSHAEADDLAAILSEIKKNHDSEGNPFNLIIVSADADIRQLASFNKSNNSFVAVYNTIGSGKGGFRKLYCNKECYEYLNSEDIGDNNIFFSNVDYSKKRIHDIINANKKIMLEEINPELIALDKIFCGDEGDCVPSFYSWFKANGNRDRITRGKAKKIYEKLQITSLYDLEIQRPNLKEALEAVAKKDINDIDVDERLHRQKQLVVLNSAYFPNEIKAYKGEIERMISTPEKINFLNIQAKDLLGGTEFDHVLERKTKKEASVFRDIDAYIDKGNLTRLF